jgi:hypothetical protein
MKELKDTLKKVKGKFNTQKKATRFEWLNIY